MFDASPVTGQPVRLMQGRYGPYVSDGATNASLPRGTTVEEVTFEYALNLLKDRAEAGPSKRRFVRSPHREPRRRNRPQKRQARASSIRRGRERQSHLACRFALEFVCHSGPALLLSDWSALVPDGSLAKNVDRWYSQGMTAIAGGNNVAPLGPSATR